MISDAQYLAWLKRDGEPRALLVEAVAYSGGAEVTRTLSNKVFISGPLDDPANAAYDDIVIGSPRFAAQLSGLFTGQSLPTWGDIELTNESGVRDSWLDDAWDGRAVRLYLGAPSWPKVDFRRVLDGTIGDIVAPAPNRLALKIRDKSWALNVPIQTALVGGTTANKDQPKPLCYGQCFNVEPLLIVAATHQYQVHDGAIEAITDVRDNGVSVTYTPDAATGTFTLNAAPAGRITADVQGAKPGGIYLTRCADIINHIVTTRTALTGADVDSANFTAFNATCPQTLGMYIRDRQNIIPALDELAGSVGSFWTFSRDGLMLLGRLEAPAGSPVLELVADDIRERKIACVGRTLPVETLRLGYARNFTPQPDGLAGSVSEANRALYAVGHQVASCTNAGNLLADGNAFNLWIQGGTPNPTQNVTGPDGEPNSAWTLTDNLGANCEYVEKTVALDASTYCVYLRVKKTLGVQQSYPMIFIYITSGYNKLAACTIDTTKGIATAFTAYPGYAVVNSSTTCEDANEFWLVKLIFEAVVGGTWRYYFAPAATDDSIQSTGAVKPDVQGTAVIFRAELKPVAAEHHKLARNPDLLPSLLALAAEAATEVARRAALYSQVRSIYEVGVWTAPLRVNLGEVVRITHPRFGFAAGALAVVVGIDEEPASGRVTLRVWK